MFLAIKNLQLKLSKILVNDQLALKGKNSL